MKKISIVTLFPEFIEQYAEFGIIARAIKNKLVQIRAVNLRGFAIDKRGTVDDRPYGGGLGMVLRADVVIKAIQKMRGATSVRNKANVASKSKTAKKTRVILMTPQGKPFTQVIAKKLSTYDHLVFISGRYEGFDERVRKFVDEEISIGDYVLMGGELPSLVISEAVLRLVPGVLGKDDSADKESFSESMLEFPQYTKPEILEVKVGSKIQKMRVPKVLLSGHHLNVEKWRSDEAVKRTKKRRPDLLK